MAVVKYRVNCSICRLSRGNPVFRHRIYKAYYERENGDDTLRAIATELDLRAPSLYNHMKHHTRQNPILAPKAVATHVAKVEAKIAEDTETSFVHKDVLPTQDYEQAIDTVLAEGLDQLKKKQKDISINQLLAAAKIKADYIAKKRGQDTEMLKTMWAIASTGQNKAKDNNDKGSKASLGTTGNLGRDDSQGKDRPSLLHQSIIRDAITQGTENLSFSDTAATNPD